MYAVIKTGGKQYRVDEGQQLDVEKLGVAEGDEVTLTPGPAGRRRHRGRHARPARPAPR